MIRPIKRDLILILLWPIAAAILSFLINATVFVSTLLFLGVPSAYLSYRNPKFIKKIAVFSLILGVPLAIIIDYVMVATGGWVMAPSVLDRFKLLGPLWVFLYMYFIAMFYETFLEKHAAQKKVDRHLKYLFILAVAALGIFAVIQLTSPSLLQINYFYLKVGLLVGLLPIILVLLKFPKLIAKFIKTGAYFFYLTFIYEITALELNQWAFPAEYQFIGIVNILGNRFPYEELIFWIILGAMATLSFYHFFDDDEK